MEDLSEKHSFHVHFPPAESRQLHTLRPVSGHHQDYYLTTEDPTLTAAAMLRHTPLHLVLRALHPPIASAFTISNVNSQMKGVPCSSCRVPAETDSEVEIAHSEDSDVGGSLLWAASLQDIESVTEETMHHNIFTLPYPHRSFKEYIGTKRDLSRAVIPAAVLAGYTGES